MMRLFLLPGDVVCDVMQVPVDSDHRQVLRSFLNMMFWGALGTAVALAVLV